MAHGRVYLRAFQKWHWTSGYNNMSLLCSVEYIRWYIFHVVLRRRYQMLHVMLLFRRKYQIVHITYCFQEKACHIMSCYVDKVSDACHVILLFSRNYWMLHVIFLCSGECIRWYIYCWVQEKASYAKIYHNVVSKRAYIICYIWCIVICVKEKVSATYVILNFGELLILLLLNTLLLVSN